jgi:hypothetical protein
MKKGELKGLFEDFRKETENSLWETKKELEDMIKKPGMIENYIKNELRNNEQLRYRAIAFFNKMNELHDIAYSSAIALLKENDSFDEKTKEYLYELLNFSIARKKELLNLEKNDSLDFHFDFIELSKDNFKSDPFIHYKKVPQNFKFFHTDEQKKLISTYIQQFGTSMNGLGIILSRSHANKFYREFVKVN